MQFIRECNSTAARCKVQYLINIFRQHMANISVVIPVYKSPESLEELCSRLVLVLEGIKLSFEIILVNDASPDNSWQIIQTLAERDERVKGISLSRNFGQHYAITAGLDRATGRWVVVMDCDLQDRPEEIPKLYAKAMSGFDVVVGIRAERKDSFLKKMGSKVFYLALAYFTKTKINNRIGNFGVYSDKAIKNICRLREQGRSFGVFALWVGFKRAEVEIEHSQRAHGKSSYSLRLLISLAFDTIVSHSNRLLYLWVQLGIALASVSFAYSIWLICKYLFWGIPVAGWTSVMVSLYLVAGLIIVGIGVVGIYIGKIFDESKNRPLYIVDETTFSDDVVESRNK